MANKYEVIDESTWERAMHCMVFRNSIEPAFCVTFEADITEFKNKVKEEGLSFTLAMVYAVCKCANEVEALRYRFLDGKVVLYERIDTAFTFTCTNNCNTTSTVSSYIAIALNTREYCLTSSCCTILFILP